jgi:hypothetical protein
MIVYFADDDDDDDAIQLLIYMLSATASCQLQTMMIIEKQ